MAQVLLHNSNLTPAPKAYRSAVEKALAAANATVGAEGEVWLDQAKVFHVVLDPTDDIALIELVEATDAAFDLVFDLAEATASFVIIDDFKLATPKTGAEPGGWSLGFGYVPGSSDREEFRSVMAEAIQAVREKFQAEEAHQAAVAAALAKARAERDAKPAQPAQPLFFKRLTDALFGKSI